MTTTSNTQATASSNSGSDVTVNVNDYDQPVVRPTTCTTPQEITVCITIRNPVHSGN